ncbi:hypothetical protein [[Hallella] seregens]|uniref:Uncharacterized protein n=1 Tax=Hallella seregens ATCC 51272 TaxID=1336250 RepID=A0ABV5ZK60_9BACT|nr:hypothetical protein [Hallella seregens]
MRYQLRQIPNYLFYGCKGMDIFWNNQTFGQVFALFWIFKVIIRRRFRWFLLYFRKFARAFARVPFPKDGRRREGVAQLPGTRTSGETKGQGRDHND